MQNPWEHFRQTPHFVLDMDKPFTAWHDQNKGQFDPAKRIHLELLPEPFLGRHEVPVTLLNLNPGFSPDDQALLPDADFVASLRKNLDQATQPYPFYLLDPRNSGSPGYHWWHRRLRQLIHDVGDDGQRIVAYSILCVELFGYHSQKWDDNFLKAPSGQYALHLAEQALNRGAIVVAMRRKWFGCVSFELGRPLVGPTATATSPAAPTQMKHTRSI